MPGGEGALRRHVGTPSPPGRASTGPSGSELTAVPPSGLVLGCLAAVARAAQPTHPVRGVGVGDASGDEDVTPFGVVVCDVGRCTAQHAQARTSLLRYSTRRPTLKLRGPLPMCRQYRTVAGTVRQIDATSSVVRYSMPFSSGLTLVTATRLRMGTARGCVNRDAPVAFIPVENVEADGVPEYLVEDVPPTDAEARFAARLKALRQARGMTQAELAALVADYGLNWHQTTVAKTERADRPLRLNEVQALADALRLPVLELLRGEEPAFEGDAAEAQRALDLAEREYMSFHSLALEFARECGEAQGRAKAARAAMEKAQKRTMEAAERMLAAQAALRAALGREESSDG